jgi:hypothetical protein
MDQLLLVKVVGLACFTELGKRKPDLTRPAPARQPTNMCERALASNQLKPNRFSHTV